MNRRGFLKAAGAAAIGAAVFDPEKLLWVPGARTFFDMPAPLIYAGDFVTFTAAQKQFQTTDGRIFVNAKGVRRLTAETHDKMIGIAANTARKEEDVLVQIYGRVGATLCFIDSDKQRLMMSGSY